MISNKSKKFLFVKSLKKNILKFKNLKNFFIYSELYFKLKKNQFIFFSRFKLKTYVFFRKRRMIRRTKYKLKVESFKKKKLKKFFFKYLKKKK